MSDREQLILYVVCASFIMLVFIIVILLYKDPPDKLAEPGSLEAFRGQNDVEHQTITRLVRDIRNDVSRILDRLGFLKK